MVITNFIVGIAGTKQSGKDTAASMISYILHKGIAQADYYEWHAKQMCYGNSVNIIHFADRLKDYCSDIFNIPCYRFDDNDIKENYVWSITNQRFYKRDDVDWDKTYEIKIIDLKNNGLNLMNTRNSINKTYNKITVISLRTIMQYIGTEIFRNLISTDIWIDMTMVIVGERTLTGYCIIPDVRFFNEAEAIRHSTVKSVIIKITRDTNKVDNHESEQIDFDGDYNIENNSTKMALFYKLLHILKLELTQK